MRILDFGESPIEVFPYWNVPQGGKRDEKGNRRIEQVPLPIFLGNVTGLLSELDALVVTSDLQGRVLEGGEEYLLGEKLPEFLSMLIGLMLPQLNQERIEVVLCGDLYATLQKRGGMGDVKAVWRKFKAEFKWVVGVAGNHDDFGSTQAFEAFKREDSIYFLQQEIRRVDKIEFGGISGIIGRSDKPNRVEEGDYLRKLKQLLSKQPHAILLHQSPSYPPKGLIGDEKISQLLESSPQNVIFCGHSHWPVPLVELGNGTQVLNVDSRVVILLNKSK